MSINPDRVEIEKRAPVAVYRPFVRKIRQIEDNLKRDFEKAIDIERIDHKAAAITLCVGYCKAVALTVMEFMSNNLAKEIFPRVNILPYKYNEAAEPVTPGLCIILGFWRGITYQVVDMADAGIHTEEWLRDVFDVGLSSVINLQNDLDLYLEDFEERAQQDITDDMLYTTYAFDTLYLIENILQKFVLFHTIIGDGVMSMLFIDNNVCPFLDIIHDALTKYVDRMTEGGV